MDTRGKDAAALALHRFGFGPSRNSITAIAADPRGALLSDLDRPGAGFLLAKLPSSTAAARAISDFRAEEQARSKLAQRAKKEAEAGMASMASTSDAATMTPPKPSGPPLPQQIFENEAAARYEAAVGADIGFVERLVWFWSNHFCISADKDIPTADAYEREAIRAHVLGRFADMLIAVETHPAMLYYLDNTRSMGADSIAGINADKGINENLAREILELHTLGVRSGYSQTDVTSFANVLTGWTYVDPADPAHGGEFLFNKRLHEPGEQTVLGRFYAQSGVDQGRAVLADLAHHTATAQHVAQKLARHFVADEPPAPNGWPDTEAAWIDGVPHRLDIANEFAGRLPSSDPAALLESGLGPIASRNTRDTIARAESRTQALALLILAPEFLRR